MLLADYAVVSDGKLTIVGGGWSQTGPEPASFGIGLLIQVPWDQANTRHSFSVELLDSDGVRGRVRQRGGLRPGRRVRRRVRGGSAAGAEARDAAGLPGGRQLDAAAPRAGSLRVEADDRRRVSRGLDDAIHRALRGAVAALKGPSDEVPYARNVARDPSRIDLLELDIDLRLADLWREAADVSDWSLEIVAAFIRAAYGKGYCDALTEESRARSASTTATACRTGASPSGTRAEKAA